MAGYGPEICRPWRKQAAKAPQFKSWQGKISLTVQSKHKAQIKTGIKKPHPPSSSKMDTSPFSLISPFFAFILLFYLPFYFYFTFIFPLFFPVLSLCALFSFSPPPSFSSFFSQMTLPILFYF
jgi:hypothetical protein